MEIEQIPQQEIDNQYDGRAWLEGMRRRGNVFAPRCCAFAEPRSFRLLAFALPLRSLARVPMLLFCARRSFDTPTQTRM